MSGNAAKDFRGNPRGLRLRLTAALMPGMAALLLAGAPAGAQSMNEALAAAYESNPTLLAQRAQLRATEQGLPEARAGWKPTVTADAQAGVANVDNGTTTENLNPMSYGINANQPLYRGGRTAAGVSRAKNQIQAEQARLTSVEQKVLMDAATIYMDVARDRAVLELTTRNEQVLSRELRATEDRRRVGELTRTDVAQAKAREAGAIAARIQAEGKLQTSLAEYERIIGRPAEMPKAPPPLAGLPRDLQEALRLSEENNPDIRAADFQEQASQAEVRLARGEMLPTLSLNGRVEHREEFNAPDTESDSAQIMAQLSIPLYQGGGPTARTQRAKETAGQRRQQLDEARRTVRAATIAGWENLAGARARVAQFEAQVEANTTALQGTRQQARHGTRILLDVLNAEQELLDAQVSLEVARRDAYVAGLRVLSLIGRLTARDLKLNVD